LSCGEAFIHGTLQRDALEDGSEKPVSAVAIGARPEKALLCDHGRGDQDGGGNTAEIPVAGKEIRNHGFILFGHHGAGAVNKTSALPQASGNAGNQSFLQVYVTIQVQDEASQLAACLLDPQPGEKILDACAGVGVKASHLAEKMQNQGALVAVDINRHKMKALRENAERLGITMVEPLVRDLRDDLDETFRGAFDGILLDVPCSGLGTLRRNPEIKWRIMAEDLHRHAGLQKRLLAGAAGCLKQGGRLVYSTCSMMPGENEAVVADFLSRRKDFRCIHPPSLIPPSMVTSEGFFKTRPDRHGTDGFFGVVLMKKPPD
jgi:16S rRNA (cytosine(967)-C(5))-methyltransferase